MIDLPEAVLRSMLVPGSGDTPHLRVVIDVLKTEGSGEPGYPIHNVRQFYSIGGELLAERDEFFDDIQRDVFCEVMHRVNRGDKTKVNPASLLPSRHELYEEN